MFPKLRSWLPPAARWKRWRLLAAGALILAGPPLLLQLLYPLPEAALVIPSSTVVTDRTGTILRVFLTPDQQLCLPVALADLNAAIIQATIATEDHRFFRHPGVDPFALGRALVYNLTAGQRISGASTLTMQVARMMEPKERTYLAKLKEIVRAGQLELRLSKLEILNQYFNRAPYGGNIRGVGAAAARYFGKSPLDLSVAEAALLAGIPQDPAGYDPIRHPEPARRRRNQVLRAMRDRGTLTESEYQGFAATPVSVILHPLPFQAPHFAEMLAARHPGPRLESTLDPIVQHLAESVLAEHVRKLEPYAIHNGAAVIIENATGRVAAYVGANDYFDRDHHGQVDGVQAVRNPGSTLKPFLYARLFDEGSITPRVFIEDIPTFFVGYDPENFNRKYDGHVTIADALIDSLNVPAVRLLQQYGLEKFWAHLQALGLTTVRSDPAYYGLGLIMGSADVTLLELTNAYATLARGGDYRPYSFLAAAADTGAAAIYSEEACYLTATILSDRSRLRTIAEGEPRFAWKTGTSSQYRDAWCVGYNPQYTVGVWMGNFSGVPSELLIGFTTAAPAVRDLFRALYPGSAGPWYPAPPGIQTRAVCVVSGLLPNEHCPNVNNDYYLYGISHQRTCTIHQSVRLNTRQGFVVCPVCVGDEADTEKVIVQWPPLIEAYLARNGMLPEGPLRHQPRCPTLGDGAGRLEIISPIDHQRYLVTGDHPEHQQLLLQAASNAGTRYFWFINGQFYGACGVEEKLFWPLQAGNYQVRCVDERGRSREVAIEVTGL